MCHEFSKSVSSQLKVCYVCVNPHAEGFRNTLHPSVELAGKTSFVRSKSDFSYSEVSYRTGHDSRNIDFQAVAFKLRCKTGNCPEIYNAFQDGCIQSDKSNEILEIVYIPVAHHELGKMYV